MPFFPSCAANRGEISVARIQPWTISFHIDRSIINSGSKQNDKREIRGQVSGGARFTKPPAVHFNRVAGFHALPIASVRDVHRAA